MMDCEADESTLQAEINLTAKEFDVLELLVIQSEQGVQQRESAEHCLGL